VDYFHRNGGELWCEDVPVRDLARRFGTPLYVYSRRTFVEHFQKLDAAFVDVPHVICFSVKSNGNLGILRTLAALGAGADVVSGGELHKALLAGIPADRIVYSGVGKTRGELELAVTSGIRSVNIENVEELRVLSEVAVALGRRQECALRVNPDVDAHTHEYLTTGRKENKFGIALADAVPAARIAAALPGIALTGLDMHIGSQILSPVPYRMALEQVRGVVADLRAEGCDIRHLDIGGGLAVRYDREDPMTADQFHDEIISLVRNLGVDLVLEPGRFIIGPAGILVGEVQFIKEAGGKRFVILDAGMNDLIRPSLYGAHHRVEPVVDGAGAPVLTDVVGPVCESGDFLGKDRQLAPLQRGDLVAVFTAGAYGFAMSSNYNQRPRAAEILVDGAQASVIRRRETFDDLVRAEVDL
jgi:diaminopimelate decarboxylase